MELARYEVYSCGYASFHCSAFTTPNLSGVGVMSACLTLGVGLPTVFVAAFALVGPELDAYAKWRAEKGLA